MPKCCMCGEKINTKDGYAVIIEQTYCHDCANTRAIDILYDYSTETLVEIIDGEWHEGEEDNEEETLPDAPEPIPVIPGQVAMFDGDSKDGNER